MTEAEWLGCENPQLMLDEVYVPLLSSGSAYARQRDLLRVACARLVWPHLPDDVREAVEWNEATAGRATRVTTGRGRSTAARSRMRPTATARMNKSWPRTLSRPCGWESSVS